MRSALQRSSGGKAARGLVVASALLAAVTSASARNGDGNFFQQLFGGLQGQEAPAEPRYQEPEPTYQAPEPRYHSEPQAQRRASRPVSRPLTVRLRRPKIVHVARAADVPTKPGKVSIYEDPTLRRGDAVMTVKGMRVFAGSKSWPYRDDDFVAVSDVGRMDKGLQKTLLALDNLPR